MKDEKSGSLYLDFEGHGRHVEFWETQLLENKPVRFGCLRRDG